MGREVEHKFLVKRELLPRNLKSGERIEQGYLSTRPAVRVRIISSSKGKRAVLTIKGPGLFRRAEFEYDIPVRDARALMTLCGPHTLTKVRRRYCGWELDEFTGRHRGLWLAEYELKTGRSKLPELPAWIGKEVTNDPRFANARLVSTLRLPRHGF